MIIAGRFVEKLHSAAPPAMLSAVAAVLLRFPPVQNSFYPRCPVYESLHLLCPGCGTTRALAALLHGHFNEAMHLNALTTLLLPIGVIYGCLWYWRFVRGEAYRWSRIPPTVLYAALGVAAIFTAVRNLPLGHAW